MSKDLQVSEISKKLDGAVLSVVSNNPLQGFEKAYQIAQATVQLKELLSSDYMKPIMALQGNKLGFKTDKDDKGGYPEVVVKNCLIEAVLTGVQPFGNQFNIIAGNCYITKEGFGYLLKHTAGLSYKIIPGLPRISQDKQSAAVPMEISWNNNGSSHKETIEFPIKVNNFMGVDAIIGKATRKARAWLYNTVNNCEIADGDVTDLGDAKVVETKINKEEDRLILLIQDAKTLDDLKAIEKKFSPNDLTDKQHEYFKKRKEELSDAK